MAVSFDLDDTLWPVAPAIEQAERGLHDFLREHCPRIAAELDCQAISDHRQRIAEQHPHLAHDFTAMRQHSLEQLMDRYEYPRSMAVRALDAFSVLRNTVSLFEEVIEVLTALKSRYTLVSITNGNACPRQTGVHQWLDWVMPAREAGVAKPHPAIFARAVERLGCLPEQVVHVGDHRQHDVTGAARAGMQAVWLDRQQTGRAHRDAVAIISSLRQLPDLLQTLAR